MFLPVLLAALQTAAISGRVVDHEGNAIADVQVEARIARTDHGRTLWIGSGHETLTNSKGEYLLNEMPPGQYILCAHPPAAPVPGTARRPTCFPDAEALSQAARLTLTLGIELSGHDIRIRSLPAYGVDGQALDSEGAPLPEYHLLLSTAEDDLPVTTTGRRRTAVGRFHLAGVPPGDYRLAAAYTVDGEIRFAATTIAVRNRDLSGIVLRGYQPFPVTGAVSPSPPQLRIGKWRVMLIPTGPSAPAGAFPAALHPDGSFLVRLSAPGNYRVIPPVFPNHYPAAIRFQGADYLGRDVFLVEGIVDPIQIIYRDDGATLTCAMEHEEKDAATKSTLVLLPVNPALRNKAFGLQVHYQAASQPSNFQQIRPGDYYLLAYDKPGDTWFEDPTLLLPLLTKAVKIKLEPRANMSLSVALQHVKDH